MLHNIKLQLCVKKYRQETRNNKNIPLLDVFTRSSYIFQPILDILFFELLGYQTKHSTI